jgi:hypothetical protein
MSKRRKLSDAFKREAVGLSPRSIPAPCPAERSAREGLRETTKTEHPRAPPLHREWGQARHPRSTACPAASVSSRSLVPNSELARSANEVHETAE